MISQVVDLKGLGAHGGPGEIVVGLVHEEEVGLTEASYHLGVALRGGKAKHPLGGHFDLGQGAGESFRLFLPGVSHRRRAYHEAVGLKELLLGDLPVGKGGEHRQAHFGLSRTCRVGDEHASVLVKHPEGLGDGLLLGGPELETIQKAGEVFVLCEPPAVEYLHHGPGQDFLPAHIRKEGLKQLHDLLVVGVGHLAVVLRDLPHRLVILPWGSEADIGLPKPLEPGVGKVARAQDGAIVPHIELGVDL